MLLFPLPPFAAPALAGMFAIAMLSRRPSGRSGRSIADMPSTPEGQQNRNRRGQTVEHGSDAFATAPPTCEDGSLPVLVWPVLPDGSLGPVEWMCLTIPPPSPGGRPIPMPKGSRFSISGRSYVVARAAFLRPLARGIRRTSPRKSRAMKATRNCAGSSVGPGGCTPAEFRGFGPHAVRVGGPIDMSAATQANTAAFRPFGINMVRIDERLIPPR